MLANDQNNEEMKILYKGTFNCSGQDVIIYRHAHSKAQAKKLMLVELAYTLNTSVWMVRMHYGDWCTNHIIEKEDK